MFPIKDIPRWLNLLLEPTADFGFKGSQLPKEEIERMESIRRLVLKAITKAQQGDSGKAIDKLIEAGEQMEEMERRDALVGVPALVPKNYKYRKMPKPQKNLALSKDFGRGEPSWSFFFAWIYSFKYYKSIPGGIPWEKIKNCQGCGKFFLKNGNRKNCSAKCTDAKWQMPYSKRREYFMVRNKFEFFLTRYEEKSPEEAWEILLKIPRYRKIIEQKNLNPKGWSAIKNPG